MNQDQTINLIQTLFKLGSGALVAKGIGDASLWEGITGAVVAIVTWYLSHRWNASPAAGTAALPATPPMSMGGTLHLLLIAGLALGLCAGLAGCGTPQRAAYVTAGSVEVSAETAMAAWNVYLGQYPAPLATELKVKAAYEKYQHAMALVCDAGAIYASTGVTNAAGLSGASAALDTAKLGAAQSLADLVGLIRSLGVKI